MVVAPAWHRLSVALIKPDEEGDGIGNVVTGEGKSCIQTII
jgi:hypothetical protein